MSRYLLVAPFIILFLINTQVWSQTPNFYFNRLTTESGLSQNTINCSIQDSKGFIWMGTEDGLNRYDGKKFVIFNHQPGQKNGLNYNTVHCILEDKFGNILVGTPAGLNVYDPRTEIIAQVELPIKDLSVNSLFKDRLGNVWAGSNQHGLFHYDQDKRLLKAFQLPKESALNTASIWCILEDSRHKLWIGTKEQGTINPRPFYPRNKEVSGSGISGQKYPGSANG